MQKIKNNKLLGFKSTAEIFRIQISRWNWFHWTEPFFIFCFNRAEFHLSPLLVDHSSVRYYEFRWFCWCVIKNFWLSLMHLFRSFGFSFFQYGKAPIKQYPTDEEIYIWGGKDKQVSIMNLKCRMLKASSSRASLLLSHNLSRIKNLERREKPVNLHLSLFWSTS